MPSIHMPKRKPKAEPTTSKVTVASVEGSLRKLEEKDLLLQTSSNRVLRFRLIAKTQFLGKDSQPIRDSLLHPGDRLTIDANPDDPETAIHVILAKSGSKSDREAAESPIEEANIAAPTAEDLGRPHTTTARDNSSSQPAPESTSDIPTNSSGGEPTLASRPVSSPSANDSSGGDYSRAPIPSIDDMVINDARDAASVFTAGLPNFLVEQATTRYQGSGGSSWRAIDVVTADVASVNGKEDYRNIRINGRPTSGKVEDTGSWSTGEFTVTLEDILSYATAAAFTARNRWVSMS